MNTDSDDNHEAAAASELKNKASNARDNAVNNAANIVGKKILALRERFALSQRELSRRAGMTNSSLSMIETGKVSPSITTLEKILNAISVSLQSFFSDELSKRAAVTRSNEFVCVKKKGVESRVMPLLEKEKQSGYIAVQTYAPGVEVSSDWMVREGYVGGVVIEGCLDLLLEGEKYRLVKGDGFHFGVYRSHTFSNATEEECLVVSVVFPKV